MVETAAIRRGYVDTPAGQVHYREAGKGAVPVVLLHQSPVSSRMFERAYQLFAKRPMRVIGIDTPGFGMSDLPDHAPSIMKYADWIASAIGQLADLPVNLVGHHTGAAIAAELVVRHPGIARALVLSGPPMVDPAQRDVFWSTRPPLPPLQIQPDGSHLSELFRWRVAHMPNWSDLGAMHRSVVDMLLNGDTGYYGRRAVSSYDMEAAVRAITLPTLVIAASRAGVYETSLRVHQVRPDWQFVCFEGATGDVVDEVTESWVETVTAFFESLEQHRRAP